MELRKNLRSYLCIIMAVIVYDHEFLFFIYIITISLAGEEDEEF